VERVRIGQRRNNARTGRGRRVRSRARARARARARERQQQRQRQGLCLCRLRQGPRCCRPSPWAVRRPSLSRSSSCRLGLAKGRLATRRAGSVGDSRCVFPVPGPARRQDGPRGPSCSSGSSSSSPPHAGAPRHRLKRHRCSHSVGDSGSSARTQPALGSRQLCLQARNTSCCCCG